MSFEGQVMSKDNVLAHFQSNGGYRVDYPSKIFRNTGRFSKLGNVLGYSPVLAREYSFT